MAAHVQRKGRAMVTIASLSAATPRPLFSAASLSSGGEIEGREDAREAISSGFKAVDALLSAGGLRRGSLVEWLAGGGSVAGDTASGAGAVSLALAIACRLAQPASGTASGIRSDAQAGPRTILVVDRGGWFHPPAVLPWLGDSRHLIVARPSHDDDEIWTIDQALRCSGVAVVVAWPRGVAGRSACGMAAWADRRHEKSRPRSPWTTAMRRWQLAARSSGSIGLFIRPATAASEPSWAEAKIAVSPLPGASSLPRASSLPGGTLLERRLRLERVGGAWNGGLTGRVTETVLDLARGTEGTLPREAVRSIALPRYREATIDTPKSTADTPLSTKRGVSCRAS